jgi:putative ABC transport system permease protein
MNLATARYSSRAREVAVRKSLGASRSNLVSQFLLESIVQTMAAALIAGILVELLIGFFSSFTGKDYTLYYSRTGMLAGIFIGIALLLGLIAGSYPAFYLSSFSPINIFKSKLSSSGAAVRVRIILVVFQFAVSIFLIIGTLTIFRQLKYLGEKDLGFSIEDVLVIPVKDDRVRSNIEEIRNDLLELPAIGNVTAVSNIPGGRVNNNPLILEERSITIEASEVSVDFDYLNTLGLEIIQGRDFSRDHGLDSISRFIINETALRELGVESPLEKEIVWMDDDSSYRGEIIGVIGDFHYKSFHVNIAPLILMIKPAEYNFLLVRLSPDNTSRTIRQIEHEWKKYDDLFTFEYFFLKDKFYDQYGNEDRMGIIYWMLAVLAIIIGSFGLFGLSTFTIEQRTQEIGIRKVHGATSRGILRKLITEFTRWVLLAFIVASPAAYWVMTIWLRDFSYQVSLPLWIFLVTLMLTEGIAILAVAYQSYRASNLKPVDSLRYE